MKTGQLAHETGLVKTGVVGAVALPSSKDSKNNSDFKWDNGKELKD